MTLAALRTQATEPEGDFTAWPGESMAVELEVAELLYALVRAMKPAVVVEAGSGKGYASRFIAEALAKNGAGHLWTYEQDPEYAAIAREAVDGLPATVCIGFSHSYRGAEPDLVFIDTLGNHRESDMSYWLGIRALCVIHDANAYPDLPAGVRLTAGRGVWIGANEEA